MYFTIGGRGAQSELFRVTYVGTEPTARADYKEPKNADLRELPIGLQREILLERFLHARRRHNLTFLVHGDLGRERCGIPILGVGMVRIGIHGLLERIRLRRRELP